MNPSLTSLQRLAIVRNNEAVFQISSGLISDAIKSFTFSLNVYRQCIGDDFQFNTQQSRTGNMDQYMTRNEEISIPENQDDKHYYVYQHGILIPQDISCDYYSNVMVSTMIIFSLALAQQLSGSNQVDTRKKKAKFINAARLYDLAFNMQQVERMSDNVYFTVATVNNLGVIYKQLGELEAANKCFEHVLSILMLVLDSGKSGPHFGCFAQNITSLMSKTLIAPAA